MKATIGGREVCWEERGEGRTILFLHGFPLNRHIWDDQLAAVPEGWRGVAVDLRGFGESAGSADPVYSMDLFADDAAALLTHLRVRRAVICGQSMGGYIAFALLRRHPSVFGGLVLVDTRATADTEQERRNRLELAQRVQANGVDTVIDGMLPRLFAPTTPYQRPELVARVRAIMATTPAATMARVLAGMAARPSSENDLRNIGVPTLVVVGSEDAITDRGQAQLMARGIRGAQIESIPDAGHLANVEAPETFNLALQRFLKSI
jgi:3-oxoadipate enol-lactonase